MEWKIWMDREVFLRLRNDRVYSGKVVSIDDSQKPVVFLTIIDKFGKNVMMATSEIVQIKEEDR